MTSEQFVQYLIIGIQDGSIYALIGLGFTIIYSVTNIINFAHGEFVMLGGMISYMLVRDVDVPTLPTVVIALLAATALATFLYSIGSRRLRMKWVLIAVGAPLGLIPLTLWAFGEIASARVPMALGSVLPILMVGTVGAILYLLAIRPARRPTLVTPIIITIGAALFIRGIAGELWGVGSHRTPPYWDRGSLEVFTGDVHTQTIAIVGSMIVVTLLLQLAFNRTMLGKSLTACAINPAGAGFVGINRRMMALIAFGTAAAIGGMIGAVMTPKTPMNYEGGFWLGLYGFVAAALGGFRSQIGAVLGGLILGIVMSLVVGISWGPFISGYKDVWAMVVLILILLVRSGRLAEEERLA